MHQAPNRVGSMDFMADRLADGRQFRRLKVLDDLNREDRAPRWICHCRPSRSLVP